MKLQNSSFKGISFGLVSGVITTLGLIIGIDAGTNSSSTVILAVMTIAFADSFSDALGVHVSEESAERSERKIWRTTIYAFLSKFLFTLSFLIPLVLFELSTAITCSTIYGLTLITIISYLIGFKQNKNKINVIAEHLTITILVIIVSYLIGNWFKNF
jgi:VIT1/CCC1 family predicted Fe2+/Mn2+ transporter